MSIKLSSKALVSVLISGFLMMSVIISAQTTASTATNPTSTPEVYTAENPGWLVNVDEAYAISKKTGKPILANFTGSDWCGWCKRLTVCSVRMLLSNGQKKMWCF